MVADSIDIHLHRTNAAVSQIWASRKLVARLRPHPEARALRGKLNAIDNYTLVGREYDLSRIDIDELETDIWILALSYEEVADYLPSMAFPSQQRVAFAAELDWNIRCNDETHLRD